MNAYHLRTFYLARQQAWDNTNNLNFFRLEGVKDGSVTVNINDEVVETIGTNVGNLVVEMARNSEISMSLVATYEQIIYILHGLFGAVTPTGSAAPYYYTYRTPVNNAAIPQFYTIVYGIGNTVYQLRNCMVTELTITGTANNALEIDVTFVSPYAPTPATLPSQITIQPVNAINFFTSEFYMSDINTIPSTTSPAEATLISFELTINPNRHIKHFIGNAVGYGDGKWQIDGSLTLEFNTTSKSLIDAVLTNHIKRNFEVHYWNPAAPLTNYVSFVVPHIINDSFDLFSDRDGNATVEISFSAIHANVIDSSLRISVASETDTLV